jgi:hypothetical protein
MRIEMGELRNLYTEPYNCTFQLDSPAEECTTYRALQLHIPAGFSSSRVHYIQNSFKIWNFCQRTKVCLLTLLQYVPYSRGLGWLRHCTTSRKVQESIPGVVTRDFFRDIRQFHVPGIDSASKSEYQVTHGGKDGRCVWLTTYNLQVSMSRNLGALTSQTPLDPIGL